MIHKNSIVAACMLALCAFLPMKADAAFLYLDPATRTVAPGSTFDVVVRIDTTGEKPTTADTQITYDTDILEVVSFTEGSATESFFAKSIHTVRSNQLYIGSYINLNTKPKAGTGVIGIVRFKAKKAAEARVNIMCTASNSKDSNISLKKAGTVVDAIDCSQTKGGVYTISSGGSVPTSTPFPSTTGGALNTGTPVPTGVGGGTALTPTATPSATPTATLTPAAHTPTPSVLPETGHVTTTGIVIGAGIILTVISFLIKLYVT